jgi:hypothetical protein
MNTGHCHRKLPPGAPDARLPVALATSTPAEHDEMTAYPPRPLAARWRTAAAAFAALLALQATGAAVLVAPASADDPRGAQQKPGDERPPERKPDAEPPPRAPGSEERPGPAGSPECVHVRTEARYIPYGYDHIVEIENTCDKAVHCSIATDVNPTTVELTVPAGQKRSVTTFRGSPAREFKPDVTCKPQD